MHAAVSSRHGPWEFLYVRTGNTEWGEIESTHVEDLHAALAASDAANVFVWIHHPPVGQHLPAHESLVRDDLRTVLVHDDRVRAIAAGHVHVPADHEFDGIPVYLEVDAMRTRRWQHWFRARRDRRHEGVPAPRLPTRHSAPVPPTGAL